MKMNIARREDLPGKLRRTILATTRSTVDLQ
jgi:hypothetical protein